MKIQQQISFQSRSRVDRFLSTLILTIIIGMVISERLTGQMSIQAPEQADSLQRVITSAAHDTIRINAMNELAEYYGRVRSQYDSCQAWAQRAESLSASIGYHHGLGAALGIIGATRLFRGNTMEAQEYFFRALIIAEEYKDNSVLMQTLNFLGILSMSQGNYAEARPYFFKTLNAAKETHDNKMATLALSNIGESYILQARYEQALEHLFQALALKEKLSDKVALSNTLYAIGIVYCKLGQYPRAKQYSLQALSVAQEVKAWREVVGSLSTLALVYLSERQYGESIATARHALEIAQEWQISGNLLGESNGVLQTLSTAYDSLGNHKKAFEYFKRYIALRDSSQNTEAAVRTSQVKEALEAEKRAKLHQAEQERQGLVRNIFLVGFAAALLVAAMFGWLYRQKQRANAEILRQQRVLEDQAHEIELTNTALQEAHEQSETLLLNILPAPIAHRLKSGERAIADKFDSVTVLFADIASFTKLSARTTPEDLVQGLNTIFKRFDELAKKYSLEKIKTIGDAYMVAGGLPERSTDHCERVASFALEMQAAMRDGDLRTSTNERVQLRIGIHTGEAVAGVIGTSKFAYDLWGDTVNTASRMESHGEAGKIHVTEEVYDALKEKFMFEERGEIEVKGKGMMRTWFLISSKNSESF